MSPAAREKEPSRQNSVGSRTEELSATPEIARPDAFHFPPPYSSPQRRLTLTPQNAILDFREEPSMSRSIFLYSFAGIALFTSSLLADEGHHYSLTPEELGTVHFATSCSPKVEAEFNRGVALLHSFWYEEAAKAFHKVAQDDPKCAMANWGIAMSSYHQLWDYPAKDAMAAGNKLLRKAEGMKATPREKEYIHALHAYFRNNAKTNSTEQESQARAVAYSDAMKQVATNHADDREAIVFYALSLLASAPRPDKTFANRKKAASLLEDLLEKEPNHPGVAHYLIHAYDKPQLAELGLNAARKYAKIAPASPHALHMPSHIFARLGLWQDDINSNLASIAATRDSAAMHMGDVGHQFHAMDFLVYAYMQSCREAEVQKVIAELPGLKSVDDHEHAYSVAKFSSLYALEMRHWEEAAALQPLTGDYRFANALIHFARAIGSARSGKAEAAHADMKEIDKLRLNLIADKKQEAADEVDRMEKEASVWVAWADGKGDDGVKSLHAIANEEDGEGPKQAGIPVREMLADMLLEMNHPQEALDEYTRSLKSNPGRFNGLYGAAQAAGKLGKEEEEDKFYAALVKNCEGSASERPELKKAKAEVASK